MLVLHETVYHILVVMRKSQVQLVCGANKKAPHV